MKKKKKTNNILAKKSYKLTLSMCLTCDLPITYLHQVITGLYL